MSIYTLCNRPKILSSGTVAGFAESEGPLRGRFDFALEDDRAGEDTYEKAESEMVRLAFETALSKGRLNESEIGAVFAGDLMNQCTGTTYGLLKHNIPYFGIFGACSNVAEGLILASLLVDGGYEEYSAACASSHFSTAERQFRMPLEYGGQRPPTAQNTVTGAAAFIVGSGKSDIYINEVMPGIVRDTGISDSSNMGAAMAPAAVDTIERYFRESAVRPEDFDIIATGDLGAEGNRIAREMLAARGLEMGNNFTDCGLIIYDRIAQDMHSGASGCACSGLVLGAYFLDMLKRGSVKDMLLIATGALMSPMSVMQGENIPGIAHLVRITKEEG